MKLNGFREIRFNEYVMGMAFRDFKVSLEFVLNSCSQDFEIIRSEDNDYIVLENNFRSYNFYGRDKEMCRLSWLNISNGRKKTKLYGFLIYNSAMGLVDFLVDKYIPKGKSPVDKFLRGKNGCKDKSIKLYQMLFNEIGQPKDNTVFYSISALARHIFRRGLPILECHDTKGRYFLQKQRYPKPRLFYLEEDYPLNGIKVPTRRFFVYTSWEHPVMYWNGEVLNHFIASGIGGLKQMLGRDIWDMFEEHGECVLAESQPWFVPQQFKPEVIIRIPSIKEAGPYLKQGFKNISATSAPSAPLYLFDTRASLKMSGKPKLITEIPEALYIASRAIDNVYVPNDTPTDPAPFLRKKEFYMGGVRPDVWNY